MGERAGGRTPGEAIAAAVAAQDREDARARAAVTRYGQVVLEALGPDATDEAVERLLCGGQPAAGRLHREKGVA